MKGKKKEKKSSIFRACLLSSLCPLTATPSSTHLTPAVVHPYKTKQVKNPSSWDSCGANRIQNKKNLIFTNQRLCISLLMVSCVLPISNGKYATFDISSVLQKPIFFFLILKIHSLGFHVIAAKSLSKNILFSS